MSDTQWLQWRSFYHFCSMSVTNHRPSHVTNTSFIVNVFHFGKQTNKQKRCWHIKKKKKKDAGGSTRKKKKQTWIESKASSCKASFQCPGKTFVTNIQSLMRLNVINWNNVPILFDRGKKKRFACAIHMLIWIMRINV